MKPSTKLLAKLFEPFTIGRMHVANRLIESRERLPGIDTILFASEHRSIFATIAQADDSPRQV